MAEPVLRLVIPETEDDRDQAPAWGATSKQPAGEVAPAGGATSGATTAAGASCATATSPAAVSPPRL